MLMGAFLVLFASSAIWLLLVKPMVWRATDGASIVNSADSVLWIGFMIVVALVYFGVKKFRRRVERHECVACGYSRAGLGPNDRCPECGTAAEEPSASRTPKATI
jgi:tRNA(Ile2) C34 agmatinyltransferase TiaS